MENSLWKILAFILCAVLLFFVPLMNMLERQDEIAFTVVFAEAGCFVDSARDTGYITPDMYGEFTDRLNATGNTYDIKLKHIKSVINPVYTQNGLSLDFSGEYEINRFTVSQEDIMAVLFPKDNALSILDEGRRYKMKAGDLLFIEVSNQGKTMAAAMRDMIMFSHTRMPSIFVRAGGMVRNEAY